MSEKEPIVENENIIEFAEKRLRRDIENMCAGRTQETKDLHKKFQNKVTSMYMITLLLYGKPVEITTIIDLSCDLHEQFFDVRHNLPELPEIVNHAINITDHLRWKGFSEISKDKMVNTFNTLVKVFEGEVSKYIDLNFENIPVSMFIESNMEAASEGAIENYADENDIEESDIDVEKVQELEKKAYDEEKVTMIKEFISTLL